MGQPVGEAKRGGGEGEEGGGFGCERRIRGGCGRWIRETSKREC
jgi:hypothetical protein